MAVRVQVPPSAPNIIKAPSIGALSCLEPANGTRDESLDRSGPSMASAIRQRRVGVRTKLLSKNIFICVCIGRTQAVLRGSRETTLFRLNAMFCAD